MALRATCGVIGSMRDCAIFADAGRELRAINDDRAWLTARRTTADAVSIGRIRRQYKTEFKIVPHGECPLWLNDQGQITCLRRVKP
jgi:hypothetical protein